ncbi:MAG: indole-3-glycerol phosphate synthase TrpC [Desulfobulbaceae bacterium]|nr:indole-3-glycerol phosphate synthase TrpC [Desulfobulbaceae bacterium]HIJ78055.1 indole-3-glycerol phosphate synthase TrpC [Deltaproteobacteria bacterium]
MILDKIVAHKKEEVAALKVRGIEVPEMEIAPPRGFIKALCDFAGVAVIAEAKKASPSKGIIRPDFDPVAIARFYKEGGAQAMSVLTDENFFQGSLSYIPAVRQAVDLPVLRKEFIIDEIQIREARVYGADAILLIAAILDQVQIKDYLALAHELGMDVLVEIHDEAEAEKAVAAGSRLIGVNNRDLRDFSMDLNTTFRLQKLVPREIPLVSESGIRDFADMSRLAEHGVAAALVGETLMRAADPAQALRELTGRL